MIATMGTTTKLAVTLAMMFSPYSSAFQASTMSYPVSMKSCSRIPSELDLFGDAMKNAFSNDDTLGKRADAGLKKVICPFVQLFSWMGVLASHVVPFNIASHHRGRASVMSPSMAHR